MADDIVYYYARQGDVGHIFRETLLAEEPVNLAGAQVRFIVSTRAGEGGTRIIDGVAAVTSTTDPATVEYTATAADVAAAGNYRGEWEVTYSDGRIQSFPNHGYIHVRISDDLDE